MITIPQLLAGLPVRPAPAQLLHQFRPPPRFIDKTFVGYHPTHSTQRAAVERLQALPAEIGSVARPKGIRSVFTARSPGIRRGVYLDGGFGVGKTHLLAALWNSCPGPKAYLSFDELMYFIGMAGAQAARTFAGYRLIAIDEWELDDPGNLKMALAFLRGVLEERVWVAVTSNTLPLELGSGRFSQKDFRSEVEELAAAFEIVRIEGEDYRHRHFRPAPGAEYFADPASYPGLALGLGERGLHAAFAELLAGLERVHPIRYRDMVSRVSGVAITGVDRVRTLPDALRWVHFVDSLYDAGVPMVAMGDATLGEIFTSEALDGPYGKKLSRCLSRLEELLGEGAERMGETG